MGKRKIFILAVAGWLFSLGLVFHGGEALSAGEEGPVISDKTVSGFVHPESAVYDPQGKVLYVGQFGSVLKPTLKDGAGKISRVSLEGKIIDAQFLPGPGQSLNKPKGMWIRADRLWVTDIDVVWIFDLKTRQGKKTELPGARFANDLTVIKNALYVSDSALGKVYRVEPADFLAKKDAPRVTTMDVGRSLRPNGLCPGPDGSLIIAGLGIYSMSADGQLKTLAEKVGRLDGIALLKDGSFLITDWQSRSLMRWEAEAGVKSLAVGFAGPADFCVVPEAGAMLVAVPDLVKGQLRLIRLSK